ncbi:MAG: ATP-dependent Clp protease proteolytic subunit [Planctomycetaceae bacterium]|nr:ATP-dependent Clp protease proteolytic subunit [Planctomycetaceae bacterium]
MRVRQGNRVSPDFSTRGARSSFPKRLVCCREPLDRLRQRPVEQTEHIKGAANGTERGLESSDRVEYSVEKNERKKSKGYPSPGWNRERGRPPEEWEILLAGDFNDQHIELLRTVVELPRNSRGTIYFDSNGGSVYTALSLMSLIRLRGLQATGVVLGECSSASLLPFAACCRRLVLPFSTHLFHAMKWESEVNVRLHEAAEWARHFREIEQRFDVLLSEMFGIDAEQLAAWTEPGRFVTGEELARAGIAELISPFEPLPRHPRQGNVAQV